MLDASSTGAAIHEVMLSWRDIGGNILYLVSKEKKDIFLELSDCSWLITVLSEYFSTCFTEQRKLGGMLLIGICKRTFVESRITCLLRYVMYI